MQVASKGPDERARKVEAQARCLRSGLKGLEEAFGAGDAAASVAHSHDHTFALDGRADREFFALLLLHRPFAVLSQVHEDLQQIMAVRPYTGQSVRQFPIN